MGWPRDKEVDASLSVCVCVFQLFFSFCFFLARLSFVLSLLKRKFMRHDSWQKVYLEEAWSGGIDMGGAG